jgi:predicted dehydrogenase
MCSAGYSTGRKSFFKLGTNKCFIELEPSFSHDIPLTLRVAQNKLTYEHKYPNINQVAREIDHFSECILLNREPYCDGLCGMKDLQICEAIYRSSDNNSIEKLNL